MNNGNLIPASLDLAQHVGRSMFWARNNPARMGTLERIYSNLTPEAKGRADAARSWACMDVNNGECAH